MIIIDKCETLPCGHHIKAVTPCGWIYHTVYKTVFNGLRISTSKQTSRRLLNCIIIVIYNFLWLLKTLMIWVDLHHNKLGRMSLIHWILWIHSKIWMEMLLRILGITNGVLYRTRYILIELYFIKRLIYGYLIIFIANVILNQPTVAVCLESRLYY